MWEEKIKLEGEEKSQVSSLSDLFCISGIFINYSLLSLFDLPLKLHSIKVDIPSTRW